MIDPQKIWSSSQLPTLPSVAFGLLKLSKDPETKIKDVVELIQTDPAISAKILKATNSTFFGFKSEITSIARAVPLLGSTVVTSMALSFSLIEDSIEDGPLADYYNSYWVQSVVQATTNEILSTYCKTGLECEFLLAGLLMDLGRLAMLKTISDDYLPVLQIAEEEQRDLFELEQELLDINHIEVGIKLAENWSLPQPLIQAIRLHHAPVEKLIEEQDSPNFELIKATALSASIGDYFCATNKGQALKRMQEITQEFYSFSDADLDQLLEKANARIEEAAETFSIDSDQLPDPSDLMAEANQHLAQLALQQHVATTQAQARQEVAEIENQKLETRNQELQKQAVHDSLTKTYNRNFFDEAFEKEINRCARTASFVGVIFIDADKFKNLNDNYGHQFGDLVLQRIATGLEETIRNSDILARYGGEEFVIFVHQPTEKGLERLAERLRARIESESILFGDNKISVTVSVGAAIGIPNREPGDFAKQLIASADESMYVAKKNGRNQVHSRSLLDDEERKLTQQITQKRFVRDLKF